MRDDSGILSDLPVLVINLDRSKDRLARVSDTLGKAGLHWQRLSAVSPSAVADHPAYRQAQARALFGRDLGAGELGCFLSHLAAIDRFLAGSEPMGLVLEDDILFGPSTVATIVALQGRLSQPDLAGWHCVNLSNAYRKRRTPVGPVGDTTLFRAWQFPLMTSALLWSRDGAAAFRDHVVAKGIFAPVDNQLREWLARTGRGLSLDPAPVGLADMPSTLRVTTANGADHTRAKLGLSELRQHVPVYLHAIWHQLRGR